MTEPVTDLLPVSLSLAELTVTRIALHKEIIVYAKYTQEQKMRVPSVGIYGRALNLLLNAFAKITLELRSVQTTVEGITADQQNTLDRYEDEYSFTELEMELMESAINAMTWDDVISHEFPCDCRVCTVNDVDE